MRRSLSLTYLSILVLALLFTPLGCEEDDAGDDWILDDTEIPQAGTDLVWLRCPLGQTWDEVECRGTRQGMDLETAEVSCPTGYRLPTCQEFVGLLGGCGSDVDGGVEEFCNECSESDLGRCEWVVEEVVDGVVKEVVENYCNQCSESSNCSSMFPLDNGWYWSSSTGIDGSTCLVGFSKGFVGNHRVDAGFGVRCLRER